MGDARMGLPFMARQPQQCGGGEAGHRRGAGQHADIRFGRGRGGAFAFGAPIVPEDRRTDRRMRRVQQDGAVHLP